MASTGFTFDQVQIILFRDAFKCPMCGAVARTANHRSNRGAGGHKGSNRLSNGCAICDLCNGRLEADPEFADLGRLRGVKLSRYADPLLEAYLSPLYNTLVYLNDDGGFTFDRPEDIG